jgi:hypothetical protein
VQEILAIQLPKGVKQLRQFLGMAQDYRDLWARRSEMLAPLTSLVEECSQTKVTKAKGTKKVPWHWDKVHQRAFDHVKATIAKEVVLAYLEYSKSLRFTQLLLAKSLEQPLLGISGLLHSSVGNSLLHSTNTVSSNSTTSHS